MFHPKAADSVAAVRIEAAVENWLMRCGCRSRQAAGKLAKQGYVGRMARRLGSAGMLVEATLILRHARAGEVEAMLMIQRSS